jgi:hypothetical protein
MDQAFRPVRLVNVAAVCVGLVDQEQPLDPADLCEILSGLYASERAGWTVFFATTRAYWRRADSM